MMRMAARDLSSLIEWGVAGRAIDGETESGDAHLLVPSTGGFLAAVVDGLGHGPEAAAASRTAVAALCRDPDAPVEDLVHRCHKDLAKTRGAVISLVSFSVESGLMTWLAVGNVEGVLYRADPAMVPPKKSLLPRGGVVGYQMPPLRPRGLRVSAGDTLVLATDGIASGFSVRAPTGLAPQMAADEILARWERVSDDALVLVVRYRGRAS